MNSRRFRGSLCAALLLGAAVLLAVLAAAGCASNEPELAETKAAAAEDGAALPDGLLSSVHMGDPRAVPQLLEGFYGLEQGVWRWTARKFSVAIQAPSGGSGQDSQLEFKFSIPEAVISRVGALTLTARVNGTDIGSESYQKSGEYAFSKPVSASALKSGEAVKVEFELDKALPPGEADQRELGLVAVSVALK
jgi:hypothetical protein